jgi:sodium/potassium-transporting ATPase subunit alpha
MVLAGTSVVAGQAGALVVANRHASRIIAVLSILLGLGLFAVGRFIGLPFWDNFVFAIGVIVANVPEGLLPTLTLSISS